MQEKRFDKKIGNEYELFKLAAPHYDDLQNSIGEIIKDNFKESKFNNINVLEIGFGDGATSKVVLSSDNRIFLTAIDNEALMLDKISRSLDGLEKSRYKIVIDDALDFLKETDTNTFDAVISAWTIHNFLNEYRKEVIYELFRVIKSGGVFINADKIEVSDRVEHEKNLKKQISEFDVFEKIGKPELKREWTEHYFEDAKPNRALVEKDFEELIKSAGFSSFKVINRWYDDATVLITK